ncbi:MAG TPA: aminoglycoside phosphotransferase family protein, partial [Acidobacteriota bacterium]
MDLSIITNMRETKAIEKVAEEFGLDNPSIDPLGSGIIHHTYKAESDVQSIVLQQINTNVFTKPEALIDNYLLVYQYLQDRGRIRIPEPVESKAGDWMVKDENGSYWRATEFISNAYTPDTVHDAKAAYTTASCFATFTKALQGINISELDVVIADFHDLSFRYHQFEDAIARAELFRAMRATHVIAELRQRKYLVDFYKSIKNNPNFPLRLMHHDCKIGNILFDRNTHEVICPIDLDTIMPGKFFSDIGDMVRTMACTEGEESRNWENIDIKREFYEALISGYLIS